MLFSSIVFLFYFLPIVLLVYYLFSFSRVLQNIWLLCVSILFYAWGEPVYVFLMLFSILINWLLGFFISIYQDRPRQKKLVLILACIYNIGILFVFKYLNFVIYNINSALRHQLISTVNISLPIGISFFTFQALSYVIDVYRGATAVEKNPFYVGLYIAFFPQLIAGPIVQYNSVAHQIRDRRSDVNKLSVGTCRFVVGLGKKILLANNFAAIADRIFNWSQIGTEYLEIPVILAWLGSFAYTLQIYYDFSAYSDMAIGLGLMFGFKFNENFNYPYISQSISEFWRRWHISLSMWFREYVYFPLGGSRVENKDRMVINTLIVWLLTGIWHGAQWTFLIWGLWNFIFIITERFFEFEKNGLNKFLKHFYTLFIVNISWVLFRAVDLYQAGIYFKNMLGVNNNSFFSPLAVMFLKEYGVFFALGIIFSAPLASKINIEIIQRKSKLLHILAGIAYPAGLMAIFLICISYLVRGSYNPFIYFNF